MIYTPQQEAFFDTAASRDSIALKARAGSGKTFSLQTWATKCQSSGLSTSFSKSTVTELGKKMPRKFPAQTLHSIGLAAIRNSGKFTKIEKSKLYDITKLVIEDAEAGWDLQSPVMKLVSLAKTFGIIPGQLTTPALLPDTPEEWENLADQYDITFNDEILSICRKVLTISNTSSLKDGLIDFDDMLYIALLWPHRFPRFPTLIGDEVQDWNTLQHMMAGRLLLPGGRIIVAGDPRQAIYAFRGALADSYSALISRFKMQELPLTVSFRCPKAVIQEAQRWVPDIEAAPDAIEGRVETLSDLHIQSVPPIVLCRNNAPLIRLALKLLISGRTAEVAGQDIGKGLISLTKRITKRNLSSSDFIDRLQKWADREISRKPRSKGRVEDKKLALIALAEHHKDLKGVQSHLSSLYPNPNDRSYRPAEVQLSTIHRAKGREWPHVLFLDPHLLPSKYAEQEWELVQEDNVAYVGVTRSQDTLQYIKSEEIYT
jgi:superfamily I DNA/RNA helicase